MDDDLTRARLIATRLKYMFGAGNTPEDLAKIFSLSLESVKSVLGIAPTPPPEPEPALARLFSHLRRRR